MKIQKNPHKVGYFSKIEGIEIEVFISALAAKRSKRQTPIHTTKSRTGYLDWSFMHPFAYFNENVHVRWYNNASVLRYTAAFFLLNNLELILALHSVM